MNETPVQNFDAAARVAKPKKAIRKTGRPRPFRYRVAAFLFLLVVILPTLASTLYLYLRAVDQYHSRTAFSIRSEVFSNPLDAISAFTQVGSSSTPDSAILYDFIRSQPLVERIDARLNLRAMFNRHPSDFVFSLGQDVPIESMLDYWDRMVQVSIDSTSGVIDVEVRAFAAQDAQDIAQEILQASSELINELSRIAREDAMRYALEDLKMAEDRLKDVRVRISAFRTENQIINPEADVTSQMDVVSALQSNLAAALVERETIKSYSGENDPRIANIDRRIKAIEAQIADERNAVSGTKDGGRALSSVIGEYEELLVTLEFSQNAYTAALAAEEQARAEARRKSRYAAVHIAPTIAQDSIYPQREILAALVLVCALAAWGVLMLIYYNARDRG